MPRYDFQCQGCGAVEEHSFSMAQKPDHMQCKCGGQAISLFSANIECIFIGNQRPFKLTSTMVPINWHKGNTDAAAQELRYKHRMSNKRKLARHGAAHGIKNDIQYIGSVPRELDRMRKNQFGKDYYLDDTEKKLQSDDCMFVK